MTWKEEGLKIQTKELMHIEGKLSDGKPLNGWERSFYRRETGAVDYAESDAGEGKTVKYDV